LRLSAEPRLEFDLTNHGIDLTKAQRVEVRLFGTGDASPPAVFTETPPAALEGEKEDRFSERWTSEGLPPAQ
jgi:hypothetical protein